MGTGFPESKGERTLRNLRQRLRYVNQSYPMIAGGINGWSELELGKTQNLKNRIEPDPKKSSEPEPKLIKYPNGFKILVSREPKLNPTQTEVCWIP